jgi:hypothetical protein
MRRTPTGGGAEMKTFAITPTWCRVVREEQERASANRGRARRPRGRENAMRKQVGIGAITAAVLLTGVLVGVARGGTGGGSVITEPTTIELHIDVCRHAHHYLLADPDAPKSFVMGQVTLCRSPIFDPDGDRAGTNNVTCTVADATDWICTQIYRLKAGPFTDAGTVVATGHYEDGEGDVLAVTGGTGAYQGVGGYAVQNDGQGVNHTLNLIP